MGTEYTPAELQQTARQACKGYHCTHSGCVQLTRLARVTVRVHRDGASLIAHLTCKAGHNGQALAIAI